MVDSELFSGLSSVVNLIRLALSILFASTCICTAQDGSTSNRPTNRAEESENPVVAVVPVEKGDLKPLIALLEEQLSRNDNCVLVDREHIDKVLKEQELAAISGASSVSKRRALGRLLGADLLVLLSKPSSHRVHYEVVISDTLRGLRMQMFKLPVSDNPEKDAKTIDKKIETELKKQSNQLKAICAVPPFTSQDLSGDYEHLQEAYARMLERILLQIPGVLVVEIAEARAIAAETSLTGSSVERPLPLYLVGKYRHDTTNPEKPPYVKITAYKGEQIVGSRKAKNLSPENAVPFLQKSVIELLEAGLQEKFSNKTSLPEYHSLAKKAKVHFSTGHYEEAAQLAEASLLLENQQPKLHHLAMSAYGRCGRQDEKSVTEALPYYDQALIHLEHFLRQSHFEEIDTTVSNSVSEAFHETTYMTNDADEEIKKAVYSYRERARDMYIRVIKAKHRAGTLTDALLHMILTGWLLVPDMYNETLRENLQKRLAVIPMILGPNVKNPKQFIRELVAYGLTEHIKMNRDKEYSWFLDQLSQYDHPAVRSVVSSERRLLNRSDEQKVQSSSNSGQQTNSAKENVSKPRGQPDIEFVPIVLERTDENASNSSFNMWGMMSCGQQVDLVWGSSGPKEVFLMKTRGRLQKIFEADKKHAFGQAVFDGKYAWLPVTGPQSLVLAINPTTGSVTQFTSEDGLPEFQYAASASVGKGRLSFSGGFGQQTDRRAYIAVLELSKEKDKRVQVIHEATKQLLPGKPSNVQYQDPELSYVPKFMISKSTDNENSWCSVLGRSLPGPPGRYPSLLINPDAANVKVIDAGVESHIIRKNVAFNENKAYWSIREGLRRLRIDSKDSQVVRELPEEGHVIFYDDRFHLVGKHWWVADDMKKPFRKLKGEVPSRRTHLHRSFVSSHYGLVFRTSDGSWNNYKVVFRDASGAE